MQLPFGLFTGGCLVAACDKITIHACIQRRQRRRLFDCKRWRRRGYRSNCPLPNPSIFCCLTVWFCPRLQTPRRTFLLSVEWLPVPVAGQSVRRARAVSAKARSAHRALSLSICLTTQQHLFAAGTSPLHFRQICCLRVDSAFDAAFPSPLPRHWHCVSRCSTCGCYVAKRQSPRAESCAADARPSVGPFKVGPTSTSAAFTLAQLICVLQR
jgi:hypothetical protein